MTLVKPVLYADDDENDIFLMERSFMKLKIPNPLKTVSDGNEAVAYLAGAAPFADREENPLPCLILLDLKMPGKGGLDVLKWLKSEAPLSGLPVIVLTSSNQESDIHRAYLLGANGFIIKPGDPGVLMQIVKSVQDYWLSDKRPPGTFTDYAAMQKIPVKIDTSAAA